MNKIETLLDISSDDPLLAKVLQNRVALGDYDYSEGAAGSRDWNADKITVWVESLLPLCQSNTFSQAYSIPADLSKLIQNAYGREATQDDLDAFNQLIQSAGSDEDLASEKVCITILSSAEFVL